MLATWTALRPWVMQTRSMVLRSAGPALGPFLFLPYGMCHYRRAECRAMQASLALPGPATFCWEEV